jgi:hypothetical protein
MTAHTRHFRSALAITLAAGAVAPGTAGAKYPLPLPDPPSDYAYSQPPVEVVHITAPSGFDWGDAAIGAAAGIGITVVAVGGGISRSRRGTRRESATAIS